MDRCGISVNLKNTPKLDPDFIPLYKFNQAFLSTASKPVSIAVERTDGQMASVKTFIHGTQEMRCADEYYVNRLVKTLLWMKGGFRIYVSGDQDIYQYLKKTFSENGTQAFDARFMSEIYEHPFEVLYAEKIPKEKNAGHSMGGHWDGCRIGFDAGGSDRKVSAIIDGQSVFSEEVVWFPKTNADPEYHYQGIVSALKRAKEHLPRVDAVGVSSAGVYINNRTMRASLFLSVPEGVYESKVKDIYIRAITDTFGDIPFEVVNDGDVTAIAGMMSLGSGNVLGIAMGTSEAGGYVDQEGSITGWLNELAFVPVDAQEDAPLDEWSMDLGCGVKYFSQDALIRLAPRAGITLDKALSPAEKLKVLQSMAESGDARSIDIYQTLGSYLGHTLAYYHELYHCTHALLLGRVMSGSGGQIIYDEALRVLREEYPQISKELVPSLPDEQFRRIGQSAAAASLPKLRT